MGYCRYCGTEIAYKRTKNNKWMPCDYATGEPHFCQENKETAGRDTGMAPCPVCGKPVFATKQGGRKTVIDYTTLEPHRCMKADITRYVKFKQKKMKQEMEKAALARTYKTKPKPKRKETKK